MTPETITQEGDEPRAEAVSAEGWASIAEGVLRARDRLSVTPPVALPSAAQDD